MRGRPLLRLGLLLALLIFIGLSWRQVSMLRAATSCSGVRIEVRDTLRTHFVSADSVSKLLRATLGDPVGHPLHDLNTDTIERLLRAKLPIEWCQAYAGADGLLSLRLAQREPILRIITNSGISCYVASDGRLFRTRPGYAALVPVLNGYITIAASSIDRGDSLQRVSPFADSLFHLASYMRGHSLWRSLIAQIYITPSRGVELIPRVGNHIVHLGPPDNYRYKLRKLRSLYMAQLPGTGINQYERIDLQYKDQVVCSHR